MNLSLRKFLLLSAILLSLVIGIYSHELKLLYQAWSLFATDKIVTNFRQMDQEFLVNRVSASASPLLFDSSPKALPETYSFAHQQKSVQDFIKASWTTGLLVIKDQKILHESYYLGQTANDKSMSWSLSKSFISTLLGIARDDGLLPDLHQTMGYYTPSLHGTAYEHIPVEDVLEMSSGIGFNEDYANPVSDINLLGYFMALGWPMDLYMKTLRQEKASGQSLHYVSPNTQALGMLLRAVTGQSVHKFFEQRLWHPMGAEHDAFWIRDRREVDLALGGLNASLRDLAKLGLLYLGQGRLGERQILSASWVEASTRPNKPRLRSKLPADASSWGYGYHWWLPYDSEQDQDYLAIGIYNQFIYVNPKHRVVIAKTSAYPDYNFDGSTKELETIAMFRAIARHSSLERLARSPQSWDN